MYGGNTVIDALGNNTKLIFTQHRNLCGEIALGNFFHHIFDGIEWLNHRTTDHNTQTYHNERHYEGGETHSQELLVNRVFNIVQQHA
ncbi:Uncharacterised protein [Vibrio cholerae]|uniref:Uncharacterized protein n=1 Tax=Vibrio cholerae TaxID=666 RepID=A0A655P3D5_VIBCL|nr:Uncharacterised protein [Vibrio cholerae]CSA13630.1 Uncharacterised protein [Vibrio cholerae]